MDWENERYVRLYTRDTTAWVMWRWEARAFLPNLMRKLDRHGRTPLDKKHGVKGLAALVQLPVAVVKAGLDELLDDGCLRIEGDHLTMPNFAEGQSAKTSAAQRKREQRERDSLENSEMSRDVTRRDSCHSSLAEPSLAEPSLREAGGAASASPSPLLPIPPDAEEQDASGPLAQLAEIRAASKRGKAKKGPTPEAARVLARMAELSGCRYEGSSALEARLREGVAVDDLLAVVEHLGRDPWWRDKRYCNADAPFRRDKFAGYLAQARAQPSLPLGDAPTKPKGVSDEDWRRLNETYGGGW